MFQAVEITSKLCVASIINELKLSSYISLVILKRGNIKKVLQVNTSLSQNVFSQYSIHNRDQSPKKTCCSLSLIVGKHIFNKQSIIRKYFVIIKMLQIAFFIHIAVFNFNDPTTWLKATNLKKKKKIMETVIKCLSNLKPKLKIYIYLLFFT